MTVSVLPAADIDRIAARLAPSESLDEDYGDHRLNPGFAELLRSRALVPAAVLILLVQRESGLSAILTLRSARLRAHSGQVAFPGGRIDPDDASVIDAAFREAEEEIALPRDAVRALGHLPTYRSGSGYAIAPVVAEVIGAPELRANPDEVDAIFEVSLAELLDPTRHERRSRVFQGEERHFYEIAHPQHRIWGVTAGIIRMFYEKVML